MALPTDDAEFRSIIQPTSPIYSTAAHVEAGVPIPKSIRVANFSPEDWEAFTEEWAACLADQYVRVCRYGGAGDFGIDVAGFTSNRGTSGIWDNYQCKRYDHALRPSDIWVEIGKAIYYSFLGRFSPPRRHYFACSKDIGTTLAHLLSNHLELKLRAKENWDKYCRDAISSTQAIPLIGSLEKYFDGFDFSIFSSVSVVAMLRGHSATPFHAVRFGGGATRTTTSCCSTVRTGRGRESIHTAHT